jgi:hypothetical protein
MTTPTLRKPLFDRIKDEGVRESVQYLYEYLISIPLIQSKFEHFEIAVKKAETNLNIPHSLGFQPKDIVLTSSIGAGVVTFNYSQFTNKLINITTTGAVTIRFFGGTYDTQNV